MFFFAQGLGEMGPSGLKAGQLVPACLLYIPVRWLIEIRWLFPTVPSQIMAISDERYGVGTGVVGVDQPVDTRLASANRHRRGYHLKHASRGIWCVAIMPQEFRSCGTKPPGNAPVPVLFRVVVVIELVLHSADAAI